MTRSRTAAVGPVIANIIIEGRIVAGSRPTASQCRASTDSLRPNSSGDRPTLFHSTACSATMRRMRRSPIPPIRMGGAGSGLGRQSASRTW